MTLTHRARELARETANLSIGSPQQLVEVIEQALLQFGAEVVEVCTDKSCRAEMLLLAAELLKAKQL